MRSNGAVRATGTAQVDDAVARAFDAATISVTGLYHYPVKSCAGTPLDEAIVTARGIQHDRELLVVDEAGHFITQREAPRLALIEPAVTAGEFRAVAPGVAPLVAPLVKEGPTRPVVIWRDHCPGVDQGDVVAEWFGAFLGVACRVVRLPEGYVRQVDQTYAASPRDEVGFADGYPFLLIAEESLADLNSRLAEPLPMNRFRPNIVIGGGGLPYVEDRLKTIRIGGIVFQLVKPCARCVITTTDQATTRRGKEPLATLATYRRAGSGVTFGQNLVHEGTGIIRRGDRVEVLAHD